MQSVATGQVLGKLLVQCRELDLDYAAEMSDSGKKTMFPGEQQDPGLEQLLMCLWALWPELPVSAERWGTTGAPRFCHLRQETHC